MPPMSMLTMSFMNLFTILSWSSFSYAVQPRDNSCVYNFEVWTPNQDVLGKIRRLEDRCDSVSANIDHEVAMMKSKLNSEMMNLTHRVEKTMLEQRLHDAQQSLAVRDVRMELMDIKADTSKLWTAVAAGRDRPSSSLADSSGASDLQKSPGFDSFNQHIQERLEKINTAVNQIKTSVGDLKAEWLMIKREVHNLATESSHLKGAQTSIRDDAAKLKNSIDLVKIESGRLKNQHEELYSLVEKVRNSLKGIRNEYNADVDTTDVTTKLTDLTVLTKHLESELARMRHENSEIRRELLTSALTHRNLSTNELHKVMEKFASIQNASYFSVRPKNDITTPRDCEDVRKNGYDVSGVYQIQPEGQTHSSNVYCEMINGSAWTVLQRRVDGSLSFVRKWLEYKYGFGNEYGEFWIGNEMLHHLTTQREYRLRIDIWDFEGGKVHAEYDTFRVESELNNYKLHVRGFKGTSEVGDSLSYHDEMAFSTEDRDNDLFMRNCAEENKGGWWFNSCFSCNLNGIYHISRYQEASKSRYPDGIVWFTLKETEYYSLRRVEMKIKPA